MTSVTTQQPIAFDEKDAYKDDDCKFSGRLLVEAFEGKFVHATSRGRIPDMRVYQANTQRRRPPEFYKREFIVEYNGEKAGVCGVRFLGDNDIYRERDEDMPSLGCKGSCGLYCVLYAIENETIPPETCHVDHISVEARFRGRGIGKSLLDIAEIDAKRRGCKAIYLWVATSNREQHLYEMQEYVIMEKYSLCGLVWCQTGEKEFARMEKTLV
ncbi:uncharacterized protein LOC133178668 [Saccostrea echinata]|uniref:uncharacterized protein LOC133178668 n=1 Tax=Saccostrea echinata TaxID=191078 RepID=UPI002A818921|nr:uncharacterized protein LOC133178668 [Saccostrea echinata]